MIVLNFLYQYVPWLLLGKKIDWVSIGLPKICNSKFSVCIVKCIIFYII